VGNPEKLLTLDLTDNQFTSDLNFLKPFVNLTTLDIGNNKFTGSLEPLKGLT